MTPENFKCACGDARHFQDNLCYTCYLAKTDQTTGSELDDLWPMPTSTVVQQKSVAPRHLTNQVEINRLDAEPPDWDIALRPFIRVGDMCIVVAPRGAGKSTLMMDIAQAFACRDNNDEANPWYKGLCVGHVMRAEYKAKSLILDADNDHHDWGTVLQQTYLAYGVPPNSEIQALCGDNIVHAMAAQFDLNSPVRRKEGIERLVAYMVEEDIKVLIMDYLWRIFAPKDNGDTVWVTDGLGVLRALCREHGITVIALSQPAIGENARQSPINRSRVFGSTQQENIADVILVLQATKNSGGIKIFVSKRRYGPPVGTSEVVQFRNNGNAGYAPGVRTAWSFDAEVLKQRAALPLLTEKQQEIMRAFPLKDPFTNPFCMNDTKKKDIRTATARKFINGWCIPGGYLEVHNPDEQGRGASKYYRWTPSGVKFVHQWLKSEQKETIAKKQPPS